MRTIHQVHKVCERGTIVSNVCPLYLSVKATLTFLIAISIAHGAKGPVAQLSPQTMAFCDLLGIDDPIALLLKAEGNTSFVHPASSAVCAIYPMNKGPIDVSYLKTILI